jgi:hypothetical protein
MAEDFKDMIEMIMGIKGVRPKIYAEPEIKNLPLSERKSAMGVSWADIMRAKIPIPAGVVPVDQQIKNAKGGRGLFQNEDISIKDPVLDKTIKDVLGHASPVSPKYNIEPTLQQNVKPVAPWKGVAEGYVPTSDIVRGKGVNPDYSGNTDIGNNWGMDIDPKTGTKTVYGAEGAKNIYTDEQGVTHIEGSGRGVNPSKDKLISSLEKDLESPYAITRGHAQTTLAQMQKEEDMTPYQKASIGVEEKKLAKEGMLTPYQKEHLDILNKGQLLEEKKFEQLLKTSDTKDPMNAYKMFVSSPLMKWVPYTDENGIQTVKQVADMPKMIKVAKGLGIETKGLEDLFPEEPTVSPLPKIGDIKNGYKFKGGNPNDQKNWVK